MAFHGKHNLPAVVTNLTINSLHDSVEANPTIMETGTDENSDYRMERGNLA